MCHISQTACRVELISCVCTGTNGVSKSYSLFGATAALFNPTDISPPLPLQKRMLLSPFLLLSGVDCVKQHPVQTYEVLRENIISGVCYK